MLGYRLWSVTQDQMARRLHRSGAIMSTDHDRHELPPTAKTVCWNASTSSGSGARACSTMW